MLSIKGVISVAIENTALCNRKCPWCPQSQLSFDASMTMAWGTLHKIVDGLCALDYTGRVHPYGNGEPLTDPEFIERVRYIRHRLPGAWLYTNTNGDYVGKPHSFEDLFAAGLNEILCNHYDDKNAHLKETHYEGVTHSDLATARLTFYNRAGNIKVANAMPANRCWWPGRKLFFNWKGQMLVCCSDWKSEYPIGSIHEQSLAGLLGSPVLYEYQQVLNEGDGDNLPLCRDCNLIKHMGRRKDNEHDQTAHRVLRAGQRQPGTVGGLGDGHYVPGGYG